MLHKIQVVEGLIHLKAEGILRVGEARETGRGPWLAGGYRSPEEIRKTLQALVQRYQTMDALMERQRTRFHQWTRQELPENPSEALPVIRESESQLEREWQEWRRIMDALRQGFEDFQEPVIPDVRWRDFFVRKESQILLHGKALEMAAKLFSLSPQDMRELVLWLAAAMEVLRNGRDGDGQTWLEPDEEALEAGAQYLVHLALQQGAKSLLPPWETLTAAMDGGYGSWRELLGFSREDVRAALILCRRRRGPQGRDGLLTLAESFRSLV